MRGPEATGVGSERGVTFRWSLNATRRSQASLSGEACGQSCVFRIWLWPSGGERQGNSVKRELSTPSVKRRRAGERGRGTGSGPTGRKQRQDRWLEKVQAEGKTTSPSLSDDYLRAGLGRTRLLKNQGRKRLEHLSQQSLQHPNHVVTPTSSAHTRA